VSPHPQPRASSTAKSTSENLLPSPHDEKERTCKTLSNFRFPARGIIRTVAGNYSVLPAIHGYDSDKKRRKEGAKGKEQINGWKEKREGEKVMRERKE
jgi:hypothetical protein